MSELTTCNFCNLGRIRERAKAGGMRVTVLKDAKWGLGGSNVYVHPAGVDIRRLSEEGTAGRKMYWAGWMQEIGKRCEC